MKHVDGTFQGKDNFNLYYQCWLTDIAPEAVLLVVHGLAEHSGRYTNMVNHFVHRDFAVYSYDLRGHGKSDGRRGYVERFSYYLDDLNTFFDIVRSKHPDADIFIVGHSMGATIATAYALRQDRLAGLILSGITLKLGTTVSPALITAGRILSVLLPKVGITVIEASAVSRDKAVVGAYIHDQLVFRGKISARLGAEFISVMQRLPAELTKLTLPILIMHGTADRLSDPKSGEIVYQQAGSTDKTLKLYDCLYHELFNEFENDKVFADMESWLTDHIRVS
ncbi:alpha/beta hydrolase [Chloroflexota bacterium]